MSQSDSVRSTAELDAALVALLADMHDSGGDAALSPRCISLLAQAASTLREAREALRIEHDRYRALLDAVPDPVSILSWDGTVLDLNKAGETAYRRPRADIIGKPIETLNPDLPADHMGPVHETLRRGETFVIEVTNMRVDGSRFPVEVHSAAFHEGGQTRIVAVARDLSARHEAESRYISLIEGIDKAVALHDAEGRLHYMNAAGMRMLELGRSDTSLLREPDWSDWLVVDEHGRPLPFEQHPAARAIATGRTVNSHVIGLFRRNTQRLVWLSVTAVPQFAPGADKPHMVLTLSSDITELKRDNALFERVQELAQIGGWQWDRSNGSLYLTPEAARILGANTTPTCMDDVLACLREPDRRRLQATLAKVSEGTGFDLELQGCQQDDTPVWVRMIGAPDPHDPGSDRFSGTLQDVIERKRTEETLRVQAQTDALTGLMNRDAILGQLDTRLLDPGGNKVALLYVDLDRFKIVNDVLGHNAGDQMLVAAARRMRDAVGSEGLIARFGGDEFVVVCAIDDDGRPERLARRIQQAFAEIFRLDGDEFSITTSIGIARAPTDGSTSQQLIQSADVAMYDSKRRTRNGWQSFSPELAVRQQVRLQTETQLRRALDNGEFHLVYQPQVDLRSGRILYAEALVRWHNPQLGEMRPDHFIDLAENTGDIIRIGHWVLQEACMQMRRWREQNLPVQRVAVNVSYRQFTGDNLGESVQAALAAANLPGHALELELTERVLVDDNADTLKMFDQLRALGVQLSIDDFGEGYSALNYLRRLPIHALKLSHSFLKGVPGKASDVAICQAVAAIAQSLGLGVVAEGVETEAQRDFLLRLGVSIGQGFLFAPGLLPGEFAKRMVAQQDIA